LELSVHRRRMLEARNVMPVDLSALPQAGAWPRHLRDGYAAEWFLATLELGKPDGFASWPSPPSAPPPPPPHLGDLLPKTGPKALAEPYDVERHTQGADRLKALREIVQTWRHNRLLYPGWLIPPPRVRENLLRSTSDWSFAFREVGSLSPSERVLALGELAWRMERALYPLFAEHEADAQAALNSIDLSTQQVGGDHRRRATIQTRMHAN